MSRISQNPNPECEYELLMFSDLSNKSEPVKFPRLYWTFKKRLTCGKNRYTQKRNRIVLEMQIVISNTSCN